MVNGNVSIRTGMSLTVKNPRNALHPPGADPQDTVGLVTEDFIIINGIPVVPEQLIITQPLVSASGLIINDAMDFETLDTTADFRMSARHNVDTAVWRPYYDNTWFAPQFTYSEPVATEEVTWIRKKFLHTATAVYGTSMLMETLQGDAGSLLFALYPSGDVYFTFDTLFVHLNEDQIEIESLEVPSVKKMPIGTDLVMLGISFTGKQCTVYLKNGDTSVINTTLPAPFGMGNNLQVNGPAGIIALDYWGSTFQMANQINSTFNMISGARRR